MDNSLDSESSSKFNERSKGKIDSLIRAFNNLGWDRDKELSKEDIIDFLNSNTFNGEEFDKLLTDKLFQVLDVNDSNKITVEEFIKGYLRFDSDLQKNNEGFNTKLLTEKNNLSNLEEQCRKYKDEKLNSFGFCENAKITVEIIDIEMKDQIEPNSEIILELLYNDQSEEHSFPFMENYQSVNKIFEFQAQSRNDHFEFVVKGVDSDGQSSDIGRKIFPLNEVTTQEEYTVQITIPEIDDEESVAALINAKITLHWSDFRYYDDKRKKSEQKIKKIEEAINKTNKYLKEINDIYRKNMGNDKQNYDVEWNDEVIRPKNEDNKSSLIDIDNNNNINNINNNGEYGDNNLREGGDKFYGYPYDREMEGDMGLKFMNNLPIKGIKLVEVLGLGVTLVALIGGCGKTDFPNQLGGLILFFGCFEARKFSNERTTKMFLINLVFMLILTVFDFIWFCNNFGTLGKDKYTGGHENGVIRLSMFTTFINILLKSFLSFVLYKVYKNSKHTITQTNNLGDGMNYP